jgi:hypothetical protein
VWCEVTMLTEMISFLVMGVGCNMSTYECALACALCKVVRSRLKRGGNARGEQASKHCPCSIVVDNGSGHDRLTTTQMSQQIKTEHDMCAHTHMAQARRYARCVWH